MSITQSQGDKMTILRNSMLLRYTAAMALFSIAINTACANSGQVGIAPVSTTTLKESILFAIDRDPSISQQAAQLGKVRISRSFLPKLTR